MNSAPLYVGTMAVTSGVEASGIAFASILPATAQPAISFASSRASHGAVEYLPVSTEK